MFVLQTGRGGRKNRENAGSLEDDKAVRLLSYLLDTGRGDIWGEILAAIYLMQEGWPSSRLN